MPDKAKDSATPHQRRQKEIDATRKLLSEAPQLLKEVDESEILRNASKRLYPTFDRSEIKFGPLLGVGGFGIVFEVKDINLRIPTEVDVSETKPPPATTSSTDAATATTTASASSESNVGNAVNEGSGLTAQMLQSSEESQSTAITTIALTDDLNHVAIKLHSGVTAQDDAHYDVRIARKHMAHMVRRNGDARYAVKRLHRDLTDLERARGMIDLAIEAKYLSVMWHPNIVKMRGMSTGEFMSPNFFIVMDRLYETLGEKMQLWTSLKASHKGGLFGIGANTLELEQLMVERLIVAYDLAAAFWYMHDHKLVYRDIKQENIGFDCRGDVKVFDMGLCKSLNPAQRSKDRYGRVSYGYLLTPRTGSVPYMAPEVVLCKPYDTQADVFSFSILLWEILSLKPAFKGYSRREYLERVVQAGERHAINRRWPAFTRTILKEAWDEDPEKRPDMKRVAAMIRGDLNAKTSDKRVQQRSTHMRERSESSFRLSRNAALSLSSSPKNAPVSLSAAINAASASVAASSVSDTKSNDVFAGR